LEKNRLSKLWQFLSVNTVCKKIITVKVARGEKSKYTAVQSFLKLLLKKKDENLTKLDILKGHSEGELNIPRFVMTE